MVSMKEIQAIFHEKHIVSDHIDILAQQNQQYESFDYEEFYGPDAYIGAWHPLITEEPYMKQGSLYSLIQKFVRHQLNMKWERAEKQSESRPPTPWGEFLRYSFILRVARPFSSLISKHWG